MENEIKLELVKSGEFLGIQCDFYKDENNNIYMTREQIGQALQYKNPKDGIHNIHSRNKDRLDKFSVIKKLKSKDGKYYNTVLYNKEGIIEICKLSSRPIKNIKVLLYMINCTEDEINLIIGQNNILYKQWNFYDKLSKALNGICEIEREVKILNYRVDFLINKHIIVEVDELGYIDRDKKYEYERERNLTRQGYVIVRYNLDGDDIFEFINNLLVKLMEYQYITA